LRAPIWILAAWAALGLDPAARASIAELDGFAGVLKSAGAGDRATTGGVEYRQSLGQHFAASFTWLNEGHLPFSHRDGQAVQLWWRSSTAESGLVFEAGLGPYRAYDGTWRAHGYYPDVAHRWGVLASAAVDWYFDRRWFSFLRFNRIEAISDFTSTAVVAGIGVRFGEPAASSARDGNAPADADDDEAWEADLFYGTRIPNSHPTPHDRSVSYGVRRSLTDYAAVSVAALSVGGQPFDWHRGVVLQGWLERPLTPALSVGAGLGALLTKIPPTPAGYDPRVRGLVLKNSSLPFLVTAVTASYALSSRWAVRAQWDRVAGGFSDCDIYLVGVGYRY
jgi:hypothetical protein